MTIERTLIGGCGVAGCLDCRPLFIQTYNSNDGAIREYEVIDFSYTQAMEEYNG
jgi:hypothetical protein